MFTRMKINGLIKKMMRLSRRDSPNYLQEVLQLGAQIARYRFDAIDPLLAAAEKFKENPDRICGILRGMCKDPDIADAVRKSLHEGCSEAQVKVIKYAIKDL